MSVQAALNSGNPNQLGDAVAACQLGNILSLAIKSMSATESGVTVTTYLTAPIANQPVALLQVVGIASAVRTVKKLRKGPVSGAGALVPAAGEVIWDGGLHLLFAAADLATTCELTYTVATDKASILLADLSAGGGA
jgi:hypothetical protein